jgi:hypothetical protein
MEDLWRKARVRDGARIECMIDLVGRGGLL